MCYHSPQRRFVDYPHRVPRAPTSFNSMLALATLKVLTNLDWQAICTFLNRHHDSELRATERYRERFDETQTELKWERLSQVRPTPVVIVMAERGPERRQVADILRQAVDDGLLEDEDFVPLVPENIEVAGTKQVTGDSDTS